MYTLGPFRFTRDMGMQPHGLVVREAWSLDFNFLTQRSSFLKKETNRSIIDSNLGGDRA